MQILCAWYLLFIHVSPVTQKHGIAVSPEVTTNGDVGQGQAEEDVSAESASRLAQESPHGGRESMLGNFNSSPVHVHARCARCC